MSKRAKIKKRVDPSSFWSKTSIHTRNQVTSSKTVNFNIKWALTKQKCPWLYHYWKWCFYKMTLIWSMDYSMNIFRENHDKIMLKLLLVWFWPLQSADWVKHPSYLLKTIWNALYIRTLNLRGSLKAEFSCPSPFQMSH